MKILNLYAGIGGNRKLWGDEHEITAVEYREDIAEVYKDFFPNDKMIITDAHEYLLQNYKDFDFIWSSPPCQTHSRARLWGFRNNDKAVKKYPDMKLYQEILFLKHYYDGLWIVENVNPFYKPLIDVNIQIGKHLLWSNFNITNISAKHLPRNREIQKNFIKSIHFDLSKYKLQRKEQIYRNCVHPEIGLHILNCAMGIYEYKKSQFQNELFT